MKTNKRNIYQLFIYIYKYSNNNKKKYIYTNF